MICRFQVQPSLATASCLSRRSLSPFQLIHRPKPFSDSSQRTYGWQHKKRRDGPFLVFVCSRGCATPVWARNAPTAVRAASPSDRPTQSPAMPKLFVEYVGMGDSHKPKDYAYSTAERTDLVEAVWPRAASSARRCESGGCSMAPA